MIGTTDVAAGALGSYPGTAWANGNVDPAGPMIGTTGALGSYPGTAWANGNMGMLYTWSGILMATYDTVRVVIFDARNSTRIQKDDGVWTSWTWVR